MLGSKNKFFLQNKQTLEKKRNDLVSYLKYKELGSLTNYFLEAYDYFVQHPLQYDGTTLVKDLEDLPNLSLSAMRHDFDYIITLPKYKGWKWIRKKIQLDWQYSNNLEKLGNGIAIPYLRTLGLWASTPLYWLYKTVK